MYVIRRTDQKGGWVADSKRSMSGGSYTWRLQHAKRWPTKEAAEKERCPNNEVIERFDEAR
jgi:hypothetical protein